MITDCTLQFLNRFVKEKFRKESSEKGAVNNTYKCLDENGPKGEEYGLEVSINAGVKRQRRSEPRNARRGAPEARAPRSPPARNRWQCRVPASRRSSRRSRCRRYLRRTISAIPKPASADANRASPTPPSNGIGIASEGGPPIKFVSAKLALVAPDALAVTLYRPPGVPFAAAVTLTVPTAIVAGLAAIVALAPLAGGVKVTFPPLTGSAALLAVTVKPSGVPKAVWSGSARRSCRACRAGPRGSW
jgi:hypothetical protein